MAAAPASAPSFKLDYELAVDQHDGIKGFFITRLGLSLLHADFERELGAMRQTLEGEKAKRGLAEEWSAAWQRNAKRMELYARIGMPLGIAIGVSAAVLVFGIVFGVLQKFFPTQLMQAVQR